ncbi:MAG: DUF4402 domain-containing protein [Gammaproteobacteria bacterium]|nr:DUF4402 domain-containing protein [Gammaproteobacteria bacterium]
MIRRSLRFFFVTTFSPFGSSVKSYSCNFLLVTALFACLVIPPAYSDTIIEQSYLDFGTIALKNNASTYTIRVRYTGQIINDPEIIIVTPGTPAEYLLTGFPASTLLTITVTSLAGITTSPISPVPGNQQFTISNFDYLPSVSTNATGEATIYVGATLTSSGTGVYDDTLYVTTTNLVITY